MRTDRSYIFHEFTQSMCPQCKSILPAKIVLENNSVYLLKNCQVHGPQKELLEEDAEYFLQRRDFDKPATPSQCQTVTQKGCPFDCGLCPEHDQHSCIGLIEITQHCDLHCPVCYANTGTGTILPMETIEKMIDFLLATEHGQGDILQISGGEPTTHPEILNILRMAKQKGFRCVMLNTNGLRIAKDEEFVKALREFTGGFEVYLQFDGFDPKTYLHFRGRDLVDMKKQAVDRLVKYKIPTTLVTTVERDINDQDIGQIVSFGVNTPYLRGVNFQPVAFFGRGTIAKSDGRMTVSGVLKRIEEQTGGMVKRGDFISLPCNVERVALTYLHRTPKGFVPIARREDVRKQVASISNTFAFTMDDYQKMAKGLSLGSQPCCGFDLFSGVLAKTAKVLQSVSSADLMEYINHHVFRITASSFVDMYNFDMKSMQKECVHVITADLKKIPFSAYNMLHRGSI